MRGWKGYVEAGGKITHIYDYKFSSKGILVAAKDGIIPPLYGAASVEIIVPEHINVEITSLGLGHNTVYYMKDFKIDGGFVPVYSDF